MFAFSPLICLCVESYCSDASDKGLMERGVSMILLFLYYNFFDWQLSCRVDLAFDNISSDPRK